MAHNSIGNQFNHNIIVEYLSTSTGVQAGEVEPGSLWQDGFTVTVGAGGFLLVHLGLEIFTN